MKSNGKIAKIITLPWVKKTLTIVSIIFVIGTYFIAISPESFLKLGYVGVFIFNVLSSGLLLVPILVEKMNLPGVVIASSLGNIPNTSINYVLGQNTKSLVAKIPFVPKLEHLVERFGLYIVFVFAMIPFPIDINALLSGHLGIPYRRYILVNFLGKILLFTLVGLGVITLSNALDK